MQLVEAFAVRKRLKIGCSIFRVAEWVNLTHTKKLTNEVKANPQKYRIIMKKTPFDYLDLHFNKFYEFEAIPLLVTSLTRIK